MVPRALAAPLANIDPRTPPYLAQLVRWYASERESVEGLFLSPIPEGAQDYTASVVADLMRSYALDGVHLDYIRYPAGEFDYSAAALQAFRASHEALVAPAERERLDRAARTDPTVWTRTFPVAWTSFRTQRLTALVQRIRRIVKAERPTAILSSAVIPDPALARARYLQDWSSWAEAGMLDVVCPMAYATSVDAFADQVAAATAGAHGRPVWMGIGAWRLPVGQTATHLTAARRAGSAGVLLFSYDSLLTAGTRRGAYFTQLRSALVNDGRGGQRQSP
jgi:uncharacterized lipoprotein YddW (UPF0748 family)